MESNLVPRVMVGSPLVGQALGPLLVKLEALEAYTCDAFSLFVWDLCAGHRSLMLAFLCFTGVGSGWGCQATSW